MLGPPKPCRINQPIAVSVVLIPRKERCAWLSAPISSSGRRQRQWPLPDDVVADRRDVGRLGPPWAAEELACRSFLTATASPPA